MIMRWRGGVNLDNNSDDDETEQEANFDNYMLMMIALPEGTCEGGKSKEEGNRRTK